MKRDPRLRGLSSEHHRALVLARRFAELAGSGALTLAQAAALGAEFDAALEPHFAIEDEVLLPALASLGEHALVARTAGDHAFLRDRIGAARAGDAVAAQAFAERLHAHVKFEERELFPACEARLADDVLAEVGRRRP